MSFFVKKVKPEDMLNEALHVTLVSCAKYIRKELGEDSPLRALATEAIVKIQGSVIKYDESSVLTLEQLLKEVVNPQLAKGYNPPIMMLCILMYLLNDVNYEPTTIVYNKYKQFVGEAMLSISLSSTEYVLKTVRTLIDLIESNSEHKTPDALLRVETAAKEILDNEIERKSRSFFMVFVNGNKDLTKYPIEDAEAIVEKLKPKCSMFDYVELIDSREPMGKYVIGNHFEVRVNNAVITEEPAIWLGALNLYTEEVEKAKNDRANAIEVQVINTITEDEVRYFANPVFTHLEDPSYSVWVGGTEVNDVYLTKLDAVTLGNTYKANGYTDVQLGVGKNEPVEPEQVKEVINVNTEDSEKIYDILVQDASILNALVTHDEAKALYDDIVKGKKAEIEDQDVQEAYKIVMVKLLPGCEAEIVNNFEVVSTVVTTDGDVVNAIKDGTIKDIGDKTTQPEVSGAVGLLNIENVDSVIDAAKENDVDKVEEIMGASYSVCVKQSSNGSLTVDVDMPKRGENPVCKPHDDTRVFEETTPAIRGLVKEDGKIDIQTVDMCQQVAMVEPNKNTKPDRNDKAVKIVLINANCDIIEFDTNNEMMNEVGKVVKQTSNVDVLKKEHGLYGKLCKDNVKGNNYDLILIEKGGYAKIETLTKFKVTAKDMTKSYLKYILEL